MGRTLLNYWLMVNDYPPTIIFDEDKQLYYNALQFYDEQDDIAPLVEFLEQQTVKPGIERWLSQRGRRRSAAD